MNAHRSAADAAAAEDAFASDATDANADTDASPSPHIQRSAASVHASSPRVASEETPKLGITSARRNVFAAGDRDAGSGASASGSFSGGGVGDVRETFSGVVSGVVFRAPKFANASIEMVPSSPASPPIFAPGSRLESVRVRVGFGSSASFFAAGASLATVTANERSPPCFHTNAAASAGCPASAKKVAAKRYLCLESSAYAFLSAASRCLASAKSREKNSARRASRTARKRPARTPTRPRLTKRSAHGFSPAGSLVAANSARAAPSTSARSASSSRSQSGAPRSRSRAQPRKPVPYPVPDESSSADAKSASCVSHCSAHANSSPRGPCGSTPPPRARRSARPRRSALNRRPASSVAESAPPSASRNASKTPRSATRSSASIPGRRAPREAISCAPSSASADENGPSSPARGVRRVDVAVAVVEVVEVVEVGVVASRSWPKVKSAGPVRGAAAPKPANPPNASASNSGTTGGAAAGAGAGAGPPNPNALGSKSGGASASAFAFAFAFDAIDSFASVFALAPAFVFSSRSPSFVSSSPASPSKSSAGATGTGPVSSSVVRVPVASRRYANARRAALLARRVFPRTNQSTSASGWYSGNAAHADAANAPRFESGFARASEE